MNRRRAPLDPGVDAAGLSALAATLSRDGLARSAATCRHIASVIAHENALLDDAGLPAPQVALSERPAQERPAEVLAALATSLATSP